MTRVLVGMMSVVALASVSFGARSLTQVPVHDRPVWQVVTGSPESPGSAVPVYSLVSDQVVGSVPVDAKFLSFGTNGEIVTFSVNGQLVYVPATAVSRLYPVAPRAEVAPPGRKTLEQLAEEYEKRVTGQAAVSLTLSDSLQSKADQSAAAVQSMGGPGVAVSDIPNYADPNNPMPGAALATGGIPGLTGMVPPNNGYYDTGRK